MSTTEEQERSRRFVWDSPDQFTVTPVAKSNVDIVQRIRILATLNSFIKPMPSLNTAQKIRAIVVLNGGKGSGFFDHKGRKGEVGGSSKFWKVAPKIQKTKLSHWPYSYEIDRAIFQGEPDDPNSYFINGYSDLKDIVGEPKWNEDSPYIWRSMSGYELQKVRETGFIQSKGPMNFHDQKGMTFYSDHPSRMYAEDNFKKKVVEGHIQKMFPDFKQPGFGDHAYIVGIKKPVGIQKNLQGEYYTTSPVSASEIFRVIAARPAYKDDSGYSMFGWKDVTDEWLGGVKLNRISVVQKIRLNLALRQPTVVENGGAGSGNFGHKGRPGEVGGSSSKGIELSKSDIVGKRKNSQYGRDFAADTAKELAKKWHPSEQALETIKKEEGWDEISKEKWASHMLSVWTGSSGSADSREVMQGASDYAGLGLSLQEDAGVVNWMKENKPVSDSLRSLGEEMYKSTQEWFRKRGITHVTLYRSALGSSSNTSRPFTSWSTWPGGFITTDAGRKNIVANVPVSQVLSIPSTGFGNIVENEVVVLGPVKGEWYK